MIEEKPIYIATDGTVFDTAEKCIEHTKAENKKILADTRLYDMFDKDIESVSDYIKTGRQFWMYNEFTCRHELITITYKRGSVAFYKKDGENEEKHLLTRSIGASWLYPRHIYVDDVAKRLVKKGAYDNYNDAYKDVCRFYSNYGLYVPDGCEIDVVE